MKDLSYIIGLCDSSDKKRLAVLFRAVASSNLNQYGESDACNFLKDYGIPLTGNDASLSDRILLDCIYLNTMDKGELGYFSTDAGADLAVKKCISPGRLSYEGCLKEMLKMVVDPSSDMEEKDSEEEDDIEGIPSNVGEDTTEDEEEIDMFDDDDFEGLPEEETTSTGDVSDITVDEECNTEEEETEDKKEKPTEAEGKEIDRYYSDRVGAIMSKLVKAYTEMFQSGYEITSFAGVMTTQGMAKLSGSSVTYKRTSASDSACKLILGKLNVVECIERSNTAIANRVIMSYLSGRGELLYFPYKMIEFAFGRKAPDGDDQESLNTYKEHSLSANWSAYCKTEVEGSLSRLIKRCIRHFILNGFKKEDRFSQGASESLASFLLYLETCLSVCALAVDWKQTNDKYGGTSVDAFKIRVCDPLNSIRGDITQEIVRVVFLGSAGAKPFSYPCSIKGDCFVKEYSHEFDHDKAQAMPLFAYKAYDSLKNQGINPTMDNLILGMASDGRILKNGGEGVTLTKSVTHFITAGSRAGKGVMTLNILASGIASNRSIFYLDRKPDMATVFQHMCPEMFVVNGGGIASMYDDYGYFTSLNNTMKSSGLMDKLVPNYVCDAFNLSYDSKDWNILGDLFYLRALRLAMGICVALYTSKECQGNPRLGGKEGIMVVIDEFSNFQEKLSNFFETAVGNIPPISFEKDLAKKMSGTIKKEEELRKLEKDMQLVFSEGSLYAVTWLKSLNRDLSYYDEKVKAGSDSTYVSKMDVFVIGQDVDRGPIPRTTFNSMLQCTTASGRYKTSGYGAKGISSSAILSKLNFAGSSIGYNLVNFKDGITDGFFGRNMDMGHDVYLAQTNSNSKAKGRLDDKASNFAYVKSFSSSVRDKIVSGNVHDNLDIANSAVYFKPFLVLNDNTPKYAEQMFRRCSGEDVEPGANWIPREVVQSENPGNTETGLCDAVGFPGYISYMGVSDATSVLRKSGEIANYVVQEVLNYPGTWLEFIMDLRFESMFSVEDIVDALSGVKGQQSIGYFNREIDKSFDEYNAYRKGMNSSVEFDENGEASAMLLDNDDDYSEFESGISRSDDMLADAFGVKDKGNDIEDKSGFYEGNADFDTLDDEEVFSLNDDFSSDDDLDLAEADEIDSFEDYYKDVPDEPPVLDGNNFRYRRNQAEEVYKGKGTQEEVIELVERLRELGYNVSVTSENGNFQGQREDEFYKDSDLRRADDWLNDSDDDIQEEIPKRGAIKRIRRSENKRYESRRGNTIDDTYDFSDGESIESYENVVKSITKDVLSTFGGISQVTSFRCKGESIIVNGYPYKCKISSKTAMSLPYDIRARLGGSCIATLYDYRSLLAMKNLRSLNFDSVDFVYDYVSTTMGYGNRVSIDLFFRDISSLRELKIGNKTFTRDRYMEQLKGQDRDMFYQPKLMKRTADFADNFIENSFKNSWAWTVDSARNKKYSAMRRVTGVAAGTAVTAASGVASAGVKVTRKGLNALRRLSSGMSKVWKEYGDTNGKR